MAKVSPFHSKLVGTGVYHDQSTCDLGNNIERKNKEGCSTRDGHVKCDRCKEITRS